MHISRVVLLLHVGLLGGGITGASAGSCPTQVAVTFKACVQGIDSFDKFKATVESVESGATVCFEPFKISKPASATPVAIEGEDVRIACKVPGSCQIDGLGTHIRIEGTGTSATVQGFYFSGADDNAIQVHKNAGSRTVGKEQSICNCRFEGNNSNNKGAAIKLMENSKSYVEDCDFRENTSQAAGGAIFIHGAEIEIVDSYFADNSAQSGGAISVENDDAFKSDFTMSGCEFTGNTARGRGPAVYVDGRDGGDPYTDGGDNVGDDNRLNTDNRGSQWDCNGVNFLTTKECDKFDSTNVKVRPAFNNDDGGTSSINEAEIEDKADSNPIVKPNDDIWLGKQPTVPAPKPTNAPPTRKPFIPNFESSITNDDGRDITIAASKAPEDPDRGYFNFDVSDSNYGPKAWGKVSAKSTDEYNYWKEYDEYLKPDLTENYCGSTDKNKKRASPIDLNEKVINEVCLEYHEIRDKPGYFGLTDSKVDIDILKDRLRIQWPRSGWWDNVRGPNADIPKGWGDHYPVTHAELIMPSAHTLNGKRFAAEWQIWLMTDRGRGTPAISMLVDIDEVNQRDNWYFQQAITAWQDEFDNNQERCRRKMRGLRTNDGKGDEEAETTLLAPDAPDGEEDLFDYAFMNAMLEGDDANSGGRNLQSRAWNPFHPNMMRSIWFWGYEGSTLTPPCYPFVEWRIIEKPFMISPKQHNQLKKILFDNVDRDCKPTSIHAEGGISVPPRVGDKGQSVHKCDCFDFLSDAFRKQNPRIRDCSDFKRNERPSWAVDDGK